MNDRAQDFIERIKAGVKWGQLKFVPLFEPPFRANDIRLNYWVLTVKGFTGWAGVGCQGYYPTRHEVLDLSLDNGGRGYGTYTTCMTRVSCEGRLTKAKLAEWRKKFSL